MQIQHFSAEMSTLNGDYILTTMLLEVSYLFIGACSMGNLEAACIVSFLSRFV